ncbi:glutamine synthetase/guanido kinase [Heliocybe sulcata]|uniref:Glutamine synthetase/guanido kinase n=1 Tax=Heliocybe sulcata TaxID=5364 RepID=A0A5C3MRU3_9AGAM|nr:glutamine synthetase/guanido kinase [Heliocybe sulcata]
MSASYGIKFTPQNQGKAPALTLDDLRDASKHIKFIRVQWVDFINTVRYRVLPVGYFLDLCSSARPGFTIDSNVLGLVFVSLAEGFDSCWEYLYSPDLATLRICPYAPGHASVMGWFQQKEHITGKDGKETLDVDLCPRTTLRRIEENAKQECNVEFLVGFEAEFILLKSTDPVEVINNRGYCSSTALPSGSLEAKVLEEIAECLVKAGIDLQMYHAEAASGQYEVVTGPLTPLKAADALVFTRETIYNVASKHGLRATFAPRLSNNGSDPGSGAHTHISLHSPSAPPLPPSPDAHLTALEAAFVSGLLASLPAACALTLPTRASYARMDDGVWSGGTWAAWGPDNRETPVRLCPAKVNHFEVKCVDGTANPHLVLAALLGAGLHGVRKGRRLEVKGTREMPASLSEEERASLGIKDRMPRELDEARQNLAGPAGAVLRDVLGEGLVDAYLRVNQKLDKCMEEGTPEEVTRRMIENY